ncbi:MAG TPA: YbhN family protein [Acidimicrobiales bacterium]|nr:YbhN family protein [Acidimicrobiales bacterium]
MTEVTTSTRNAPAKRRRWLPRTVRHLAELLVLGFLIEYVLVPQIGGTHKALHELASANPVLPLAALAAECLALVAYFQLTRLLIPRQSDPGLATVSRIQLSTLALSHCVVGGNPVGYLLGYRLFTKAGVSAADASVAMGAQAVGSAMVLNVLFWVAVAISIPFYGFQVAYLVAAIVGLLLITAVAALFLLFTRGDARAVSVLRAIGTKLPFLHSDTLPRLFTQLVASVRQLARDKRQLGWAMLFAAANWLLDATCLYLFLGTFGAWVNPVALIVAYGAANIVGAIPVTPGGLGVIEFTIIPILVGFGPQRSIVLLAVVGWRLVNFWLPIPVGGLSYLSLRVHPPAADQAGLAARRALWRARWAWFVDLFGRETPDQDIEEGLSVMGSVPSGDGGAVAGPSADDGHGPGPSSSTGASSISTDGTIPGTSDATGFHEDRGRSGVAGPVPHP